MPSCVIWRETVEIFTELWYNESNQNSNCGGIMKKKHFILILAGIILLMILTFTLQCLFSDQTTEFGLSCGAFFLSVFCLVCYKNALTPSESWGPINPTKQHYEKKGELPKYQNLCKILLLITTGVGALSFIGGIGEVLFHYVKALFVH